MSLAMVVQKIGWMWLALAKYLADNGWYITKNWQDADLILFNACGRSEDTASFSINVVKEIQSKKRNNQQLVVWGCLPKIDLKSLNKRV